MKKTILKFTTCDFDCVVRADLDKVQQRQSSLKKVLIKRLGKSASLPRSRFRFTKPIVVSAYEVPNERIFCVSPTLSLPIITPIFFENTSYEIEIKFTESISSCLPTHHLKRIQNDFTVSDLKESKSVWIRISLGFRNDLGWFSLPFSYIKNGVELNQSLSFQVWPFKMAMEKDLNEIYKLLDDAHPLLRFSLTSPTEQDFNRSKLPHEPFELLWLAEFKSLNDQLKKGYKQILNAPHNRLLPEVRHLKAERLKGKLPNKLAEKVRQDIKGGQFNRHYAVDQKRLSVDTPENQFIKASLSTIIKKMERLRDKIDGYDQSVISKPKSKGRVFSKGFYDQLDRLIAPYQKFKRFPLFKEVSDFKGFKSESLVLQQKTGYSAVYQAWHKLKYYLDVLGKDASISVKNIAELYEVWCFLQLADLLKESFGFKSDGIDPKFVELDKDKQGLEYSFKSGQHNFFKFSRGENDQKIEIELRHEFAIGEKNSNASSKKNVYIAWMAEHKPDIFMKVTFADGQEYVWLFDAKYRIDVDSVDKDWVPVDALAQMHRYRDAIIFRHDGDEPMRHSRPVYGAYALYPGYYKVQKTGGNPYNEAIDAIDIGAFPFLPGSNNQWLIDFLANRLGLEQIECSKEATNSGMVAESIQLYETSSSTPYAQLESAKILPTNHGKY